MYFGALCAGADLAGALTAMRRIDASGRRISLIFKDVKARFLKRAEGDVLFCCEDGEAVDGLVRRAIASGEREELPGADRGDGAREARRRSRWRTSS